MEQSRHSRATAEEAKFSSPTTCGPQPPVIHGECVRGDRNLFSFQFSLFTPIASSGHGNEVCLMPPNSEGSQTQSAPQRGPRNVRCTKAFSSGDTDTITENEGQVKKPRHRRSRLPEAYHSIQMLSRVPFFFV